MTICGRLWAEGIQLSIPDSRMFVGNVFPSNVDVELIPTPITGSGWTLVCSEPTLTFPMARNEPPREVTWHGVPGEAATDSSVWSIQVKEAANCAAWNSGGGRVVARKAELAGTDDAVVLVPTLVMAPRPFRKSLALNFGLPKAGPVKLSIYDVQGREVWRVDLGFRPAGNVRSQWDGTTRSGADASPGVYFVRAHLGGVELGGRVVRLK